FERALRLKNREIHALDGIHDRQSLCVDALLLDLASRASVSHTQVDANEPRAGVISWAAWASRSNTGRRRVRATATSSSAFLTCRSELCSWRLFSMASRMAESSDSRSLIVSDVDCAVATAGTRSRPRQP